MGYYNQSVNLSDAVDLANEYFDGDGYNALIEYGGERFGHNAGQRLGTLKDFVARLDKAHAYAGRKPEQYEDPSAKMRALNSALSTANKQMSGWDDYQKGEAMKKAMGGMVKPPPEYNYYTKQRNTPELSEAYDPATDIVISDSTGQKVGSDVSEGTNFTRSTRLKNPAFEQHQDDTQQRALQVLQGLGINGRSQAAPKLPASGLVQEALKVIEGLRTAENEYSDAESKPKRYFFGMFDHDANLKEQAEKKDVLDRERQRVGMVRPIFQQGGVDLSHLTGGNRERYPNAQAAESALVQQYIRDFQMSESDARNAARAFLGMM